VLRVFRTLLRRPVTSIGSVRRQTGLSFPAAAKAVETLEHLGVVREITGRRRDRVYAYARYLEILSEGANPTRTPA